MLGKLWMVSLHDLVAKQFHVELGVQHTSEYNLLVIEHPSWNVFVMSHYLFEKRHTKALHLEEC
jgi:hypothetical protein